MKKMSSLLKALLTVVYAILCGVNTAAAASGTWNGTANNVWVNSANWSAAPYAGAAAGETATFSNPTGATTLSLAGLASIRNIIFDAAAAPYTLGSGVETLVIEDSGEIRLTSSVANDQAIGATIKLGAGAANASYLLRNDKPGRKLTVNAVTGTTGGTKTLNLDGSGDIAITGNLTPAGSSLFVNLNNTATLTLSGNNTMRQLQVNGAGSVINIAAGNTTLSNGGGPNLTAAEDCTVNGPGKLTFDTAEGENYGDNGAATGKTLTINAPVGGVGNAGFEFWHGTYRGTIALLGNNDFKGLVVMNVPGTISCTNINNKGVSGNLGMGTGFVFCEADGARLLFTGVGNTTDRDIQMRNNGIIEMAGSGNLNFTSPIIVTTGTRTLTLQGSSAGTGEFSGLLRNDAGTLAITKKGSGTWTLSAANTYSGATAINAGTLVVSGANGAIKSSSAIAITADATLRLRNAVGAANADRLSNAAPIALSGGKLDFAHDSDLATSYSEAIGTVTLVSGASVISCSQAGAGQSSTLTIATLKSVNGTVDFSGPGLGDGSGQNKIIITGQPEGLIGAWATVNGGTAYAAYSDALGVHAATTSPIGIAARGPGSVIPDNATAQVIINSAGTSGPITLAGSFTNKTFALVQDTNTAAVVETVDNSTGKTLQISTLKINAGRAALTIGENEGDGSVMAQSVGGIVLLENYSTSELKLNAAVKDNTSASAVNLKGAGTVRLTGANTYTGPTQINQGTLIIDGAANQELRGMISGAGAITKAGTGTLTLSGANTYDGETVISEGVVYAQNNRAFGSASGGTTIQPGATLEVGGTIADNNFTLDGEMIIVSGTGVEGKGAIVNNVGGQQYNAIRKMTLAGNTTFSSNIRWDMRDGNGLTANLYMNGFDITKIGTDLFVLVNTQVEPGAGNINVQEGGFRPEIWTDFKGSASNTMTIQSGTTFDWYQSRNPVKWSLALQDGAKVNSSSGNDLNWNIWSGPVTVDGTATLQGGGSTSHTISGPISGNGSIYKTGDAAVYLRNTNNTYTGTTTVNQGMLYAEHTGTLPGYDSGKVTVNRGNYNTLAVKTGDGVNGWSNAQIKQLQDNATFTGADAHLGFDTAGNSLAYPYNFPVPMGISKLGGGTLTIPEGQSLMAAINIYGGSLVMHNIENYVTNCNSYLGVDSGNSATLTLSGNSTLTSIENPNLSKQQIYVGLNGKGVLVIKDNAAVTNKLMVGNGSTGAGAVYQSGGIVDNLGGAGNDGRIGMTGYGYYELNQGYYKQRGYSQLGRDASSIGILRQNGGTFEQSNQFGGNFGISRGGTGVYHQRGGVFTTPAVLEIGDDSDNSTTGGFAEYTIEGGEATITSDILLANRTNMFAVLNLNGGVVSANRIYRNGDRTGSQAYVNFNGGTYQERNGGAVIDAGKNAPNAVNIFAGGAVIDSQSYACTMPLPLLAPTASGVASINVLTPGAGYIGPPMVRITGGNGYGATAVANINYASGTLTSVTITSPGYGYTTAPTVALSGGGATTPATVALTLGANLSGGLTKIGSGSLALNATNTYTGVTVISNGVLQLGFANALPAGNAVRVDGGTYNLSGFTITNSVITVSSGTILGGNLVCDSLTKSGEGAMTLAANLETADPFVISGGSVKLVGTQPGLYAGTLAGAFNEAEPNPGSGLELSTTQANVVFGEPYDTTFVYSGYVWNHAAVNVTWTFAENFDDNVLLKIDGVQVLRNTVWDVPSKANYTLTPGPHAFEARFGQGGGGGGPPEDSNSGWFKTNRQIGFGVDFQGRNQEVPGNYQRMIDPGDGTLFTTTASASVNVIDASTTVEMAPGTALDLCETAQSLGTLIGSGTVSNGTLAVTTSLAPGGVGVVGTLAVGASLTLSGDLLIDVAANGSSDLLAVTGNLDLSAGTLTVANPGQLDTGKQYTIATCSGTLTQPFTAVSIDNNDNLWVVKYYPDGTVKIIYQGGTLFILR
ncbi:MAG: autotransporter-associated beta strand repeat-containing protein [Kiritimatiellae bacterium]|nr:autotransporter-associated beta strand repeat-containing protein [Kiritimatiellia bacterium]